MKDLSPVISMLKNSAEIYIDEAKRLRIKEPKESFLCFKYSQLLSLAAETLERPEVELEIEGGGSSWWYVCSKCHTAVDCQDKFCRQCGGRFKHHGKNFD